MEGVSESYLRKGPLDADKSIAETLNGQIVLILDTANDSRVQYRITEVALLQQFLEINCTNPFYRNPINQFLPDFRGFLVEQRFSIGFRNMPVSSVTFRFKLFGCPASIAGVNLEPLFFDGLFDQTLEHFWA